MKIKAAEVSILVPFCLYLLRRYGPALEHADGLIESGVKLVELKHEIRTQGAVFEPAALQRVFDQLQRHLILCDEVGIHMTPKHHLSLHLVVRTVPQRCGRIGGRGAGVGVLVGRGGSFVLVLQTVWANPC